MLEEALYFTLSRIQLWQGQDKTQENQISQSSAVAFRQSERHRVVTGLWAWGAAKAMLVQYLPWSRGPPGKLRGLQEGGGCPGLCWLQGRN